MRADEFLKDLQATYAELANPEEAEGMKAYMKHHFEFYGIKKPLRAEAQKVALQLAFNDTDIHPFELIQLLYQQPQRELHYFAIEFAIKAKLYKWPDFLPLLEWMTVTNAWWDSVDTLATKLYGKLFQQFPELSPSKVEEYIHHENMWMNRVAMIYQLTYKYNTDTAILEKSILAHAHSKEFFHRKAAGWALRQYARTNPEWVHEFVMKHQSQLSGLTIREALKNI